MRLVFDRGTVLLLEATTDVECMQVAVEADGLDYLSSSIALSEIRKEERYGGVRANFEARMEWTKIHLQPDIGFGDIITPAAIEIGYPTLLEHAAPILPGYQRSRRSRRSSKRSLISAWATRG